MATIVEVLASHPDYKERAWSWNDTSIDPQNQAELDQEITRGTPPQTRPLFVWREPVVPEPTYAELHNRRAATDEIIADNKSGDTARDRDAWLSRASEPAGVDEGFRRILYYMEQQDLFIRDLVVQVRALGGTINRVIDPMVEARLVNFRNKSREFDPNAGE